MSEAQKKPTVIFEDDHWLYVPRAIPDPDIVFDALMEQVKDKVAIYQVSSAYAEGKTYDSHRLSCVFSDDGKSKYDGGVPPYKWEESSIMCAIKSYIERLLGIRFDYALCHLYRDGKDHIGAHRDKEGMKSTIASVSLGATRKFRMRKMSRKNGWDEEFNLESGSMIVMKASCQHHYLHWVPEQKRIMEPRINLTFRQDENRSS
jgi:alkylated DNA repair dioxygenase AlkB